MLPMTMPFTLPDWAPWWVQLLLLVPALLYALTFLFMPFSVIGLKTRMEALELRLADLQNEIRQLSLRLPAGATEVDFEDVYTPRPAPIRPPQALATQALATQPGASSPGAKEPPLGRAPNQSGAARGYDAGRMEDRQPPSPHMRPIRAAEPPARPTRSEPRLDSRR